MPEQRWPPNHRSRDADSAVSADLDAGAGIVGHRGITRPDGPEPGISDLDGLKSATPACCKRFSDPVSRRQVV